MPKIGYHVERQGSQGAPSTTSAMRLLLAYGIVAGPLYLLVSYAQTLLRPDFDAAHNDLSILANGELGWIQTTNLVLTGALAFLS